MDLDSIEINMVVTKDNWQEKINELKQWPDKIREKFDVQVFFMKQPFGKYKYIAYFTLNEDNKRYVDVLRDKCLSKDFDDSAGYESLSELMEKYKKKSHRQAC